MGYFTEENHPELMNLPLKGALLAEFIELLKDGTDLSRLGLDANLEAFQSPDYKMVNGITQKIIASIMEKIYNSKAKAFGLDANDIMAIVRKVVDVEIPDEPTEIKEAIQVTVSEDGQRHHEIYKEVVAINIVQTILSTFSMCLAVQEGKQSELLDLVDDAFKQKKHYLNRLQFSDHDKKLQAEISINNAATALVLTELQRNAIKQRNSPVLELDEQIIYGQEYPKTRKKRGYSEELDYTIELMAKHASDKGDVFDSSTEVGRQNIREARTVAIKIARDFLGVQSREID